MGENDRKQCETTQRKGVKGLLLVGHEEVPCGFGLRTGDPATQLLVLGTERGLPAEHRLLGRTRGYLSYGLIFLFLRYSTRTGQRGEGRTACVCGYPKEL